ncbi:MAG: 4Fe-4S dicluster domain-containing protein [Clostridia bacterium]|nr:4Fe-4S dicluster domain-containing protein [Clostridia bacterium]
MKKIHLIRLPALFDAISAKEALYLPVDSEAGADFKRFEKGDVLSRACNTNRSAKDFFFPQVENMANFKVEGKKIEVIDIRRENEDFVIFGARACDVRSFDVLDRVFLADPVDTFYKNRREHVTVVSIACSEPEETCFCTNFGIDAASPAGDVSAWYVGEEMFLRANTEKGTALLDSLSELLEEAEESAVEEKKAEIREILDRLPLRELPTHHFKPEKLMEHFNDPKWASLSGACIGCGTCTFVCPTCQCFDIRDFDTGHGIQRYRCWDSCMYSDFTQMAAAQPRLTQLERFRQRFMHKLVYYPANNEGIFGCVGCGRCLAKCPIAMNIAKVVKEIGGDR